MGESCWFSKWLSVKNLLVNEGDAGDVGLIPGSERFPGVGNGNLLQCSYLENSMDRGAWWAIALLLLLLSHFSRV